MTEIRFYHLTRASLESALPVMLERTLARGQKAVVRTGSEARAEALCGHLWTYKEAGFLPHGTAKDGAGERQPVWLTAGEERPNGAEVLFLTDGAAPAGLEVYELCAPGRRPGPLEGPQGRWSRADLLAADRHRVLGEERRVIRPGILTAGSAACGRCPA
jgi:DNA polymerase-3 subunit chi